MRAHYAIHCLALARAAGARVRFVQLAEAVGDGDELKQELDWQAGGGKEAPDCFADLFEASGLALKLSCRALVLCAPL